MKIANSSFTGDNKHRCCKVQVVTNLWPAVAVQSNNFACRKLGSSSRKHHAMLKNLKSWLMWEEVRVSTIWGSAPHLLACSCKDRWQITATFSDSFVKVKGKLSSTLTVKCLKNVHHVQVPCCSVPCAPRKMLVRTVSKVVSLPLVPLSCKAPSDHTRL